MPKIFSSYLFCAVLSCFFWGNAHAQTTKPKTTATEGVKWYLYGGISANSYAGDLSSYERWGGFFHAGILNYRKRWLTPRFELSYGSFSGQNPRYNFADGTPNTFFAADMFTVSAHAQINIVKNKFFNFYISQGIGLAKFWLYDKDNRDFENQTRTRAIGETYSTTTLLLPTNIGGKYIFPNDFSVGVEVGWLNTMTDYLDNISKWGTDAGNDNILRCKFSFYAPLVRLKQ